MPPLTPEDTTEFNLETDQDFFDVAIGRHTSLNDDTDLYYELVLARTTVDHDVPKVEEVSPAGNAGPPAGPPMGPPQKHFDVSTRLSVLKDDGVGFRVGVRNRASEKFEIEAGVSYIDIVNEEETALTGTLRYHLSKTASVAGFVTFASTTDRNFDNIRKFGIALRLGY